MNKSTPVLNVMQIVREFMKNEARTLEISKGKMLNDQEMEAQLEQLLKVS